MMNAVPKDVYRDLVRESRAAILVTYQPADAARD